MALALAERISQCLRVCNTAAMDLYYVQNVCVTFILPSRVFAVVFYVHVRVNVECDRLSRTAAMFLGK